MQFSEVSSASPINNRESRRESWPPHPVNPGYNNPFHDPISPGLLSCFSGRRSNFQPKIRRGNTLAARLGEEIVYVGGGKVDDIGIYQSPVERGRNVTAPVLH